MDVLNKEQKEFFKQYIEKYDIKREGDGFWKLVEIQMALKTGNSFANLEVLTAEDYSSEQLEQGRIAIEDGVPLDVIHIFYKKEKSAEEMRKARQDFIFNREKSKHQDNQDASIMNMSDTEYLSKYLPAEEQDSKQEDMDKLKRLEKVVDILEKRLSQFKDNIEQNCSKIESEYKEQLARKEETINSLQSQINNFEAEKDKWNARERQYKREIGSRISVSEYGQVEAEQNRHPIEIIEKVSLKEKIMIFFNDKKGRNNKQVLENLIVKSDLSAEQLQVINEAINSGLPIDKIRKVANKKYSVEKMQQLIRFYQNQTRNIAMEETDSEMSNHTEERKDLYNEEPAQEMYGDNLEHKYDSYEEPYNSYDESYSEDYQEEYEEDEE